MLMIYGLMPFMAKMVPFDSIERSRSWRWANNDRVANTPAYQFIGPSEETISLSGILMPEYTNGPLSLEIFNFMASRGEAYLLMSGYGKIYGYYFLDKISDTQSFFMDNGYPQKIEFTLSLKKAESIGGKLAALAPIIGKTLTAL